jgi:hypothetical protein
MARIRTIKPDAFTSDSLSSVPRGVRWTFAGLWTYADDQGRARDDVRLIKAALYPLDDDVSLADIAADLERLAGVDCICRYEVDGKRFLHMPNWGHQRINRPTASKLPPCGKEHSAAFQQPLPPASRTTHAHLSEPSPPERNREQGREHGDGEGNARGKRGTKLPKSWVPNEQHTKKAAELELDLDAEVEAFRDHAAMNGVVRKDWDAAFRMWMRNSAKWGNDRRNPNRVTEDANEQTRQFLKRLAAGEKV